eukprot:8258601-Pyramimonas_sp.AAC.1
MQECLNAHGCGQTDVQGNGLRWCPPVTDSDVPPDKQVGIYFVGFEAGCVHGRSVSDDIKVFSRGQVLALRRLYPLPTAK